MGVGALLVGSCPQAQRLTWHLVQRRAASPPLPGDGSGESKCPQRPASLGKQVPEYPPAGGHSPQVGRGAMRPGGQRACPGWPVSAPLSPEQPLQPAAAKLLPASWRPGGLACRGRAYSSPPQEVMSSHSLQGGVRARILGSGEKDEEHGAVWWGGRAGGLGPQQGMSLTSS